MRGVGAYIQLQIIMCLTNTNTLTSKTNLYMILQCQPKCIVPAPINTILVRILERSPHPPRTPSHGSTVALSGAMRSTTRSPPGVSGEQSKTTQSAPWHIGVYVYNLNFGIAHGLIPNHGSSLLPSGRTTISLGTYSMRKSSRQHWRR